MSSGSCSTSSAAAATGTSPPVLITSAQSQKAQKTLNCLLCLTPVKDYSLSRLYRKVLRSTSQRMFEYICSFLDIEVTDYYLSRNRCDNRSNNKDAKLLPGNFPLCQKCRESYYGDLYQEFVQYETVVANLSEKISKYVTKPIAISADADGEKAPGQDEHEMMSSVRKVREKVLEKNLMGFAEKSGEVTERPEAGADNCSEMDDRTANLDSEPSPDVETVTPSVSVKPAPECVEILSSSESESNSASSESENDDDLTTNQGDFSYMVKKPAPGVIHIIPALSMRDSSTPVPMRIRSTAAQGAILKPKKRPQPPQFAVIETYDGNSQKVEEKRIRVITKRRGKTRQDNLRLCKFCNQSFPTIAALTKHEVTVHGKLKPEKCEKCEYRAITKPELRAHMEKHLDPSQRVKPFQCSECGARFITNNKLLAHMRTHTGEKPYVCEICGKSFSCKESMKLCVDKHNGVTHHECPWCQKRCLRKEVMAIHMRTHTGEKPFVCQICDKRFAQRAALRVHLKVHNK